jgi:uncharacterized protein YdeI (YjbR/CyaY-like superfamily)
MGKKDPRVDAYIADAEPFARPILQHLRDVIGRECPAADETIRWGAPFFDYKGLLCGIAGFKRHCALIFWRDVAPKPSEQKAGAMGHLGKITSLKDLPPASQLKRLIREAVKKRDARKPGRSAPAKPTAKPAARPPADLLAALNENAAAKAGFDALSPSQRRDYIEWLVTAKKAETRAQRLQTALSWLAEGKSKNWKYERSSAARR